VGKYYTRKSENGIRLDVAHGGDPRPRSAYESGCGLYAVALSKQHAENRGPMTL
jgi:hypothetical protein